MRISPKHRWVGNPTSTARLSEDPDMFERFSYLLKRLATRIWLTAVGLCVASFLLGVRMLGLDRHMTTQVSGMRLFALLVDSARQVLSVIAGSVISVGGVMTPARPSAASTLSAWLCLIIATAPRKPTSLVPLASGSRESIVVWICSSKAAHNRRRAP